MEENCRIYNEDCITGMSRIPDGTIDMICCDLPYGVLNKGNSSAKWDSVIPFDRLWEQYNRVIKDDGVICLFGQGMFSAMLMCSNPDMWRYNLIWEKDRSTGFLNANRMPLRCHEDIMIFYRKPGTYNPQMEYAPDRRNHSRGKGEHKLKNQVYGDFTPLADENITDYKYPRSVIKVNKEHFCRGDEHPTQKPVKLIEWLVKTYSNEGDVVLDNCMGSGTTAVACLNTNRNFIGFEITREYYDLSMKRIDEVIYEKRNRLW